MKGLNLQVPDWDDAPSSNSPTTSNLKVANNAKAVTAKEGFAGKKSKVGNKPQAQRVDSTPQDNSFGEKGKTDQAEKVAVEKVKRAQAERAAILSNAAHNALKEKQEASQGKNTLRRKRNRNRNKFKPSNETEVGERKAPESPVIAPERKKQRVAPVAKPNEQSRKMTVSVEGDLDAGLT